MSDFLGLSENSWDGHEEDDIHFKKALDKRQFQGKAGHKLMELQKSYKDDKRFQLDKKFRGDIESSKVSKQLKNLTHAFDEPDDVPTDNKIRKVKKRDQSKLNEDEIFREEMEKEKNKNLSILSSLIPNQEFLSVAKRVHDPKSLIIKRFDPKLNIGKELLIPESKPTKINKPDNVITLARGFNPFKDSNTEVPQKNNKKLNKKEKDKVLNKVINEMNNQIEQKIEINYDSWKDVTKNKGTSSGFSLFDGPLTVPPVQKTVTQIIKPTTTPKLKVAEKVEEVRIDQNGKLLSKKRIKDDSKKIKREEAQKKAEEREAIRLKDEKTAVILKENLLEEFEQNKVEDYMRYVSMVREKKFVKGRR